MCAFSVGRECLCTESRVIYYVDPLIVHPGMSVHFDPPSLNIPYEGVVGPRNFKLGGVIEKSYGFTFVGCSMENAPDL